MSHFVLEQHCSQRQDSMTALQCCEATVITVLFSNPRKCSSIVSLSWSNKTMQGIKSSDSNITAAKIILFNRWVSCLQAIKDAYAAGGRKLIGTMS